MPEGIVDLPKRIPIIGPKTEEQYPNSTINREWLVVTEHAKRDLVSSPVLRQALLPFCTAPVSEVLPGRFVQALKDAGQYPGMNVNTLSGYLSLPAVPDGLTRNLRIANQLGFVEEDIERGRKLGMTDAEIQKEIQRNAELGRYTRGITAEEARMVYARYIFARDVKILGLAAELVDAGDDLKPQVNGDFFEFNLPSGIKIVTTSKDLEERADLLSPHLWQKRRQLKDRVYEIEVNGHKYILKEKKTSRHLDIKKGGHVEGLSAEQEFKTAKFFKDNVHFSNNEVSVDWETPIASVSYPDGFQFALFKYEEDLVDLNYIRKPLVQAIERNKEDFEEEFQRVAGLVPKILKDPRVADYWAHVAEDRNIKDEDLVFTFRDYAAAKAAYLIDKTIEIRRRLIEDNLYQNSDYDGDAYRIREHPFRLEQIGFDFEYFSQVSQKEADRRREIHKKWERKEDLGPCGTNLKFKSRYAALFALKDLETV